MMDEKQKARKNEGYGYALKVLLITLLMGMLLGEAVGCAGGYTIGYRHAVKDLQIQQVQQEEKTP